jgi:PleD family two-component response regulator
MPNQYAKIPICKTYKTIDMGNFKADILVVDDTVSNLLLLERIFGKSGYETKCITNGELAIADRQK